MIQLYKSKESAKCTLEQKAYLLLPRNIRSSRPEVFCKIDVFKNFAKFTGEHLCQKVAGNSGQQINVLTDFAEGTMAMWASFNRVLKK